MEVIMNANTERELKGCFDYFWHEANTDKNSPGYGLIRDKNKKGAESMASIASVGFGLSAVVIGAERGYITKAEARERIVGTLKTFLYNAEHSRGFFYHFLNMKTAGKYEGFHDCASIIDTSLFLNGAITAAEYFKGEAEELLNEIYRRVNWQVYYDAGNNWFYMGYDPNDKELGGGRGQWDMYAEQLMQYILSTASETFPVQPEVYYGFRRDLGSYGGYRFYNSPGGSLFTHQFSHGWYDFRDVTDRDSINWHDNSVTASKAARQYCIDNPKGFKTWHANAWGLTACQGPEGYRGYGSPPFHPNIRDCNDGTIPPCGAIGSVIFTPDESLAALDYYYTVPGLAGKYGLNDAYNQDKDWVCDFCIGIDKGISIIMLENALSGMIHELYMGNEWVKRGAERIGLHRHVA
jgi:hypothetical protein